VGYSSTWVGIGGRTTPDLIEAGTEQDWTAYGAVYYAWDELLPHGPALLGQVSAGDRIAVTIDELQHSTWDIRFRDITQHSAWGGPANFSVPGTSAEWVVEAPTNGAGDSIQTLPDFGAVTFSSLGIGGPRTQAALATPVYMVKLGTDKVEAYPSQYDAVTNSFKVLYGAPDAMPGSFPAVPVPATTAAGGLPVCPTVASVTLPLASAQSRARFARQSAADA
jgi:hypothetical protein